MKRIIKLAVLGGLLMTVTAPALADKAAEDKINARQGYYQLVLSNAGPLFGMAKGDIEYDAQVASTAAKNLQILSTLDNGHLWTPGTSKEEMPGKTRALKDIWDTYPAIGERVADYKKAVDAMAANAGNGLDSLRANVGALGASCKACHDDFRADQF